jgi:hypothetical protein
MDNLKLQMHLPIDINAFGFVEREIVNNVTIKYKCGRDFFYYALNYFMPKEFNKNQNFPTEIENKKLFGLSVPTMFAWTMLQFYKVPKLFKEYSLRLSINNKKINTFFDFVSAMIFSRISFNDAIQAVKQNISEGNVVGVDIALRLQGLEDHIMFVYGYNDNELYVFDTNKIPKLEYDRLTNDDRFIMKLPIDIIKKRWKMFSRIWIIAK